ncbi:MAG: PfkB family carbohydrate kinase [Planctomycetota bacterium]
MTTTCLAAPPRLGPDAPRWARDAASAFAGRRVTVVGDAVLDVYRAADGRSACYAGGAAVIAGHLHALGATPRLITRLGDDGDGRQLRRLLEERGVACHRLPTRDATPLRVRRVMGDAVVATAADRRDHRVHAAEPRETRRLVDLLLEPDHLDTAEAVVFADFGHGTVSPELLDAVLPELRPRVRVLAGDVSGPRVSLLAMRGFDLLTPTEAELRRLVAAASAVAPLDELARHLVDRLTPRQLLVTRDRRGCVRYGRDGSVAATPSPARRVVDEVGAGDALLAAATLCLCAGYPIEEAVDFGQTAAAASVMRTGNAPVGWDALLAAADMPGCANRPAA